MPDVDIFASRINHMVPRFFSWRPDPACEAVNAFNQSWHGVVGYAFPPFNLLGRVINKIVRDQATVMLIFPFWPTQPWFPLIADLLVDLPLGLPSSQLGEALSLTVIDFIHFISFYSISWYTFCPEIECVCVCQFLCLCQRNKR